MKKAKGLIIGGVSVALVGTIAVWVYFVIMGSRVIGDPFVPGNMVLKSHEAILGAIGYKQQTHGVEKPQWFSSA